MKHVVFAEKDVLSSKLYSVDEKESAIAEATLLDEGAMALLCIILFLLISGFVLIRLPNSRFYRL